MIPLILASGSPRRRALLEALGLEVQVIPSDAEEVDAGRDPATIVINNARVKRDAVAAEVGGEAIVIGADTLVFLGDEVLSKPADAGEARSMLRRLSGATHQVRTGVAVVNTATGASHEAHEATAVTFRPLTDAQIARFVEVVNPLDRAGAYTVDGPGTLLVARYEGCYQNVLGLPIPLLDTLLCRMGVDLFGRMERGRARFL
jgi:septum formation protein